MFSKERGCLKFQHSKLTSFYLLCLTLFVLYCGFPLANESPEISLAALTQVDKYVIYELCYSAFL